MRALFKSVSQMPDRYKCCPSRTAGIEKRADTIVELEPVECLIRLRCNFCGRQNIGRGYHIVGTNTGVLPDMVDIDEGVEN